MAITRVSSVALGERSPGNSLAYPVATPPDVDVLVVGGGGGTSSLYYSSSGGGGAGGYVEETMPGYGSFSASVGAGGTGYGPSAPANAFSRPGQSGNPSTFGGLVALGGGHSGNLGGSPGGSGGGGGSKYWPSPGGRIFPPGVGIQGNNGGAALQPSSNAGYGGGGGGAGGAGATGNVTATPGGVGAILSWLSTTVRSTLGVGHAVGSDVYFAGGGAGLNGAGSSGGGGAEFVDGTANTGGGAGSGTINIGTQAGQDGGSGCVVLRTLKTAQQPLFGPGLTVASDTSQPTYNYYALKGGDDDVLFPSTGELPPKVDVPVVQYLVVGGGGGGGNQVSGGGGGGAGGVLEGTKYDLEANRPYTIVIGPGGPTQHDPIATSPAPGNTSWGFNGVPTSFGDILAVGGGGGGERDMNGATGGSGGGGGGGVGFGGIGTPSQGNGGGNGYGTYPNGAGGGGGGAGNGGQSATSAKAGDGGIGVVSTIITGANATSLGVGEVSGSDAYFGGGGGGGRYTFTPSPSSLGVGGLGGGGDGSNSGGTSQSGTDETGGGGGGSRQSSSAKAGGRGVVVLRLLNTADLPTISAGLTYSAITDGSDRVLAFHSGAGYIVWE